MRALQALLLAWTLMTPHPAAAQVFDFEALAGWAADDHLAALQTFRATCDLIKRPDWQPLCRVAQVVDDNPAAARTLNGCVIATFGSKIANANAALSSPIAIFTCVSASEINVKLCASLPVPVVAGIPIIGNIGWPTFP